MKYLILITAVLLSSCSSIGNKGNGYTITQERNKAYGSVKLEMLGTKEKPVIHVHIKRPTIDSANTQNFVFYIEQGKENRAIKGRYSLPIVPAYGSAMWHNIKVIKISPIDSKLTLTVHDILLGGADVFEISE